MEINSFSGSRIFSTSGPRTMPIRISPRTEGISNLSNTSPIIFANIRIVGIIMKMSCIMLNLRFN
ncbi:MAG: hypothetical protein DRO94_03845 [Candidatus Altiarchaeales archaeon]|nr:MAG: hypothetical protein DRO94_03845 [Candidatus Altiarchaeales archaeon]